MTTALATNGTWVADDPVEVATYTRLTGSAEPHAAGLAVVQARRAFTQKAPLPPGGVLLGIDSATGRGWVAGARTEYRCDVDSRTDRAGRSVVTYDVDLRTPGEPGEPAHVRFLIRWEAR